MEIPAVSETHWTRLSASVADVAKGLVVFRGHHPSLPLEVLVDGVVKVHGCEEGLVSPYPAIVFVRIYVLVLPKQLWVVLLYAPRA